MDPDMDGIRIKQQPGIRLGPAYLNPDLYSETLLISMVHRFFCRKELAQPPLSLKTANTAVMNT